MKNILIRNRDGSILITCLWIIAILFLLALGIGFRASIDVRLNKYKMDSTKARYLAKAGLVKAQDLLSADNNDYDSLYACGTSFTGDDTPESVFGEEANKLGGGSFSVYYTYKKEDEEGEDVRYGMMDEERKININLEKYTSPDKIGEYRRILGALFTARNIEATDADKIINAMIDWQDADNAALPDGAEDDTYYQSLEHPYKCKNADFSCIEELLLVKWMTIEIFNEIKNYITTFGSGKINLNTASREVLNAMISDGADTYNGLADAIVGARKDSSGKEGSKDAPFFSIITDVTGNSWVSANQTWIIRISDLDGKYFTYKSNAFTIISRGEVGKITKTITAVIDKGIAPGSEKVVFYHEE